MSIDAKDLLPTALLTRLGPFTDETAAVVAALPAAQQGEVSTVVVAKSLGATLIGHRVGWLYLAEVHDPAHPPADLGEAISSQVK